MTRESIKVLNIVVVGDASLGKTTLSHRYIHDQYEENLKSTINCGNFKQMIQKKNMNIQVNIWDTAG